MPMRVLTAAFSLGLVLLAGQAQALSATIEFTGRVSFISDNSGLDGSVLQNTRFQGSLSVDLDGVLLDPPGDQNPPPGFHAVQIDAFQLTIGNYSLTGGGQSSLIVFDESQVFGEDVVRFGVANLQSTPVIHPNGTLFMTLDFSDGTRDFVSSTDFLFPIELSNWSAAGLTFTEFVPGTGFVPKFLARFSTWSVVPEPGLALMGCAGATLLATRRRFDRA